MPPYKNPDQNFNEGLRFVRVHGDLRVGETLRVGHRRIVEADGITALVENTRKKDPRQVDAGYLYFSPSIVIIIDGSDTLDLPVAGHFKEAREITTDLVKSLSPNREVRRI